MNSNDLPMRNGFTVKPYKHPTLKFVVRGKVAGKWQRKFFPTRDRAETFSRQQNLALLNQGREGVDFPSSLRVAALECSEMLAPFGVTLTEAVRAYVAGAKQRKASASLASVIEEVIAQRRQAKRHKEYIKSLVKYGAKLVEFLPGKMVSDVTGKDLQQFISSLGYSHPTTINYVRTCITNFFSHAANMGYALTNPAKAIKVLPTPDVEPGIFTPDQARFILDNAPEKLIPFLSIGLFAGLRTSEIRRLDWSEIDLQAGLIELKASKTKSARRRFVKIEPVLKAWLEPMARPTGKVTPPGGHEGIVAFRAKFPQMAKWPHNAARHSFCSYHLAKWNDAPRLAHEMGHMQTSMLYDHYRSRVRPEQAEKYWQTFPAGFAARSTIRAPWEIAPYQVKKNSRGQIYVKWPTAEKMKYKSFPDETSAQAWADAQNAPWHQGETLPGVRERKKPGKPALAYR